MANGNLETLPAGANALVGEVEDFKLSKADGVWELRAKLISSNGQGLVDGFELIASAKLGPIPNWSAPGWFVYQTGDAILTGPEGNIVGVGTPRGYFYWGRPQGRVDWASGVLGTLGVTPDLVSCGVSIEI